MTTANGQQSPAVPTVGHTLRRGRAALIVLVFAVGLVAVAALRYLQVRAQDPPVIAGNATVIYVGLTVLATILLTRAGVPFPRLGFASRLRPAYYLLLGLLGLALLQLAGWLGEPLWILLFGEGRDLSRFAAVAGSPSDTLRLLLASWVFAAFGEEMAFRIVLMRGIASALGDSRLAFTAALILQAAIFGLVHAYQGPAGVAGTFVSGLIYGGLTLAARGTIWPAAIAHGLNNTVGILAFSGS